MVKKAGTRFHFTTHLLHLDPFQRNGLLKRDFCDPSVIAATYFRMLCSSDDESQKQATLCSSWRAYSDV